MISSSIFWKPIYSFCAVLIDVAVGLSESSELDELSALPVGVSGRSSLGGEVRTLSVQTSALATGGGETAHLSVLLGGVDDPVDSGVVSDGGVSGVDHDDLEPLVHRILANPIRVEDSQSTALAADSLLSDGAQVSDKLLLSDTGVLGLSVVDTLGDSLLSVTSLHADSVHDVALLSLVSQAVSLVGTRRLAGAVDRGKLTILPSTKSEDESHDIRLLLVPELLKVLVRSH